MGQLTFLSEEPPANPSLSQDLEADWMMTVATWPSNFLGLLNEKGPSGWFGRTSPASCHQTEDGTLVPFSGAWSNAGMGSPTECLTLTILAAPFRARECLLSAILETGDHLRQFYLSENLSRIAIREAAKGRAHIHYRHKIQAQEMVGVT